MQEICEQSLVWLSIKSQNDKKNELYILPSYFILYICDLHNSHVIAKQLLYVTRTFIELDI